jgi:hypothetical protein
MFYLPGSPTYSERHTHLLLVAASCALSALAILRDPLINDDGVLYLVLAQTLERDGLEAALALFGWPWYSVLIAALHGLTGLSLVVSAHLLDTALLALLALGFCRLVAILFADPRAFAWAALVLLLLPQLNEYRSYVIRDSGFWALLLSALVPLARFDHSRRWADAAAWTVLVALAALFRPEALVFAVLLPALWLAFEPDAGRLAAVLRLYACLAALALLPLLVLARLGHLDTAADLLFGGATRLVVAVAAGFDAAVGRYASAVLDRHVADLAGWSLAAGLLMVLVLKFAKTLGLAHLGLLAWGTFTQRARVPDTGRALWRAFAACSLLVVLVFLAWRQFLTGRYLMPLVFAALVPCTLAVRELLERALRRRWRRAALTALVVVLLLDSFVSFGTRKGYVHESIAWMSANLPANATVFSNDRQLAWYSARRFEWREVERARDSIVDGSAPLAGVDFWVVHINGHQSGLEEAIARYGNRLLPVRQFDGPGGRRILILRRALAVR